MKKMLAYYLNPKTDTFGGEPILDDLKCFYDMLDCELVEMHDYKLGDKWFNFIMDEEGLFKDDLRIGACDENMEFPIIGSVLITGEPDDEGELTTLTQEDVEYINQFIKPIAYRIKGTSHINHVIFGLDV